MRIPIVVRVVLLSLFIIFSGNNAFADLSASDIFNGNVGISIDGIGSNSSPVGNVDAYIPVGSTILKAYLYTAGVPYPFYPDSPHTTGNYNMAGITLAGNPVTNYSKIVGAVSDRVDIGRWYTGRADVTDIVKSLASGGPSYSWAVIEGSSLNNRIDGSILAVVYENSSLPKSSVVILDGGQRTGGETTTVSLLNPLGDISDPGFFANMSLGISFSTGDSQHSVIDVNGSRLSSSAGGCDDGVYADGGLFTVGGIGDSTANPVDPNSTASLQDDELYSLAPFLKKGDMSFNIFTKNDSNDDNIFFMALSITGDVGSVNQVPEPATMLLLGLGLVGLAGVKRKFNK